MRILFHIALLVSFTTVLAQHKVTFQGQASAIAGYSPDAELDLLAGARYIPQINYLYQLDSNNLFDIELSYNLSGNFSTIPLDTSSTQTTVSPYRAWARYYSKHLEVRAGLQKIDFGSATLLRPLQWFNEIDPRDPLQLTNGVYGVLTKYSFLNNANIWVWGLYGNLKTRGFDAIETNKTKPEIGGRIQLPTKDGEIALSYHHRIADASKILMSDLFTNISEDRIAIDGKWDKTIGLWFEASQSIKNQDIGFLTNQSMLNVGMDYTFGIGNGLNAMGEHLVLAYNSTDFNLDNIANITATTLSYPLGMFDNLMTIAYYNWQTEDLAFFINYQHSFNKITGYVMAFYNPATQQGIRENDFTNSFSGPGIRLMCVYNH